MKRCNACNKIPIIFEWSKIDGNFFCWPCAEKYIEEKKQKEISIMLKEKPTILFKINEVKTESHINSYDILHGTLVFTNRAVYFITLSVAETEIWSYKRVANEGGAGLLGLAVGSVFSKFSDIKAHKASEKIGHEDLFQILEKSKQLLIFPKNNITNITYSWNSGLKIDMRDNFINFKLRNKKDDYKKHESDIKNYLQNK